LVTASLADSQRTAKQVRTASSISKVATIKLANRIDKVSTLTITTSSRINTTVHQSRFEAADVAEND